LHIQEICDTIYFTVEYPTVVAARNAMGGKVMKFKVSISVGCMSFSLSPV
jgi:hypothetical protein